MKMNAYKGSVKINGLLNKVAVINLADESEDVKANKDIPIHHIQILDRSGSMSRDIHSLIQDVKKSIRSMKPSDFFTIIWFSGHNEFKTIIKGAAASGDLSGYDRMLDSIDSVIGCTCFSDPIDESKSIVAELKALCPNFSVTLFTDGAPVCPWSEEEEDNKVQNILKLMRDDIIAFNTVGYGNYYNRELLEKWSNMSDFGRLTHASKITEYLDIFDMNYEIIKGFCPSPIKVECDARDSNSIFYITRNSASLYPWSSVTIRYSDKNKNQIVIVGNDNKDFLFTVNDVTMNTAELSDIREDWMTSAVYKMAYAAYSHGADGRKLSLDLLQNVRDRELIDEHINSFTPDEIASHEKKLRLASTNTMYRNPDTCDENYIPDENVPCVMDLISALVDAGAMYLPSEVEYTRIGRKVEDQFNLFTPSNDPCPIIDMVFNSKKLNISMRFVRDGIVSLNPIQAKRVGLNPNYPAKVFRTHTIVKDGFLNIEKLPIVIRSDELSKILNEFYTGLEYAESVVIEDSDYERVIIDLTKFPIVNRKYCNTSIEDIYQMVRYETELESMIKVNKYLLDQKRDLLTADNNSDLTPEQIEVLKDHGISDGVYNSIAPKTPSVAESDFYMSRTLEFSFKGFSKLDPVQDVIDDPLFGTDGIKTNRRYMCNAYQVLQNMDTDDLQYNLKSCKKQLSDVRMKIASVKISKILTGEWFTGLTDTKKPGVYEYIPDPDVSHLDIPMIVKAIKEKTYI